MRRKRRLLKTACLILASFLILPPLAVRTYFTEVPPVRSAHVSYPDRLTVCHLGDFHATIEAPPNNHQVCEGDFDLSIASRFRLALDRHCSEFVSLRVFSGDLMSGSEYDSVPSEVAPYLLKYWNIDVWTLGNHEFIREWGLLDTILTPSVPPLALTNLKFNDTAKPSPVLDRLKTASADVVIFETAQMKICVFGWTLDSLKEIAKVQNDAFTILDYATSLTKAVETHKSDCVDICQTCTKPPVRLLISHAGYGADVEALRQANSVLRQANSVLREAGIVHLVLGGHSHTLSNQTTYPEEVVPGVTLSHTGSHGKWLGVSTLDLINDAWIVNHDESHLIPVLDAPAVETPQVLQKYCQDDAELLSEPRIHLVASAKEKTDEIVADNLPSDFKSRAYDCREGPCELASIITGGILRAMKDEVEALDALDDGVVLLGMETAGDLRSQLPAECDSVFKKVAGGCYPSNIVSAFDVDKLMPFRSKLNIVQVDGLKDICGIIYRSVTALYKARKNRADGKMRSSAFVHFSGLMFTPDSEFFETATNEGSFAQFKVALFSDEMIMCPKDDSLFLLKGECTITKEEKVDAVIHQGRQPTKIWIGTTDWLASGGDGLVASPVYVKSSNNTVNEVIQRELQRVLERRKCYS